MPSACIENWSVAGEKLARSRIVEAYRSQCQVVRNELVEAKSEHYHNKLSEDDNHNDVYSIANN